MKKERKNKHAARQRKHKKNSMAHRIRNSLIPGCPEPAHSHQHCQSSAWLSLSVHHWLWNRFYPQYSNEIHRTSSVRKSLETREKNSTKTGKAGQPFLPFLIRIIVVLHGILKYKIYHDCLFVRVLFVQSQRSANSLSRN